MWESEEIRMGRVMAGPLFDSSIPPPWVHRGAFGAPVSWHTDSMSVFVLVHGSMHGSWCWRDLVPELVRRGHRAVTPDLPCDDVGADLQDYAAAVEVALEEACADGDLVLVGHSLGSRTIPIVASRRPGSRMIFLCSVPTDIGPVDPQAFAGMVTEEFAQANFDEREDGAQRLSEACARELFFHDCEAETARWAAGKLRWQGGKPLAEPAPLDIWPDVPLDVILTRDDRVVRFGWVFSEASRWLGAREPTLLSGGHSPFLSRPGELAEALIRSATR
jgi:pimeloyl-ACP methyl ester carboxylesterase